MFRVAIGGIATESSSFTAHQTLLTDFEVSRGPDILDLYGYRSTDEVMWLPLVRAVAPPGGPVLATSYDELESELLTQLEEVVREGPLDGLLLEIHGAMIVAGRDSAEERLLRHVREVVGSGTVVAAAMDPHGNLSRDLVGLLDIASSHRHSPHTDYVATRDRVAELLLRAVRTRRRPAKAWVRVPALLAGERTSTLAEPGRRLFIDAVSSAIAEHDVWDVALWAGRAWADESRCAAAVLVLADDPEMASEVARRLAETFWRARTSFSITVERHGNWQQALEYACAAPESPVFISDSGDNVTAGGSGDITYAIHATRSADGIDRGALRFLFAGLVDPPSVHAAAAVGEGALLRRGIGAVVDTRFGGPVEDNWRVEQLFMDGDRCLGALLSSDSDWVIVQIGRAPFVQADDPAFTPGMLKDVVPFGIEGFDVVVVKNGYFFPSQVSVARGMFLAVTPGGSDLDFTRLTYRKRSRPMYPLDDRFTPSLEVRVGKGAELRLSRS